jgi:hypothetical protein
MEAPARLTLRIFVSSPGDVPAERDRAAGVVARLQDEFVQYAVLEPFFWEDEPARATETFQSQFPEASGMDIVVGILWARIGTPLPMDKARPDGRRCESGTVYELETAAESYRSRGTPDLVVYRRTIDPPLSLHDEVERQRRLAWNGSRLGSRTSAATRRTVLLRHIQRTIVELVGCHVKMPRIFFTGLEPERGRHGNFLFESSEKVRPGFDLFIYQRSLVRGSTPFTLSVTLSKGLPPAIFPVSRDRWTPFATRD